MSLAYLLTSLQIVLTGFFIYRIQRFLRTHRTWELASVLIIFVFLNIIAIRNGSWTNIHKWLPTALMIFVFLMALEPELIALGSKLIERINPNSLNRRKNALGEIARAASALAATKTGALIAFERSDSLLKFGATGIEINADVKKELLTTLFTKDTPTHDGGVLIRRGRATHCGAVFPLSERRQIENGLGTRHRAALGLTEKTDAVCLIVSEEEGTLSLAKGGELIYSIPPKKLEGKIRSLLSGNARPQYYPLHYFRRFSAKLVQSNFVQFSRSTSQFIYDLVNVFFWLSIVLLSNPDALEWYQVPKGQVNPLVPDTILEYAVSIFLNAPWIYAPFALLALSFFSLIIHHNLTLDGMRGEIKKESRLLFFPVFRRRFSVQNIKAVILKREYADQNLWSVSLQNKKRKDIFIDRCTSSKTLSDSAKKIRDVLRIELVSQP